MRELMRHQCLRHSTWKEEEEEEEVVGEDEEGEGEDSQSVLIDRLVDPLAETVTVLTDPLQEVKVRQRVPLEA
jgi:hypothetical protein